MRELVRPVPIPHLERGILVQIANRRTPFTVQQGAGFLCQENGWSIIQVNGPAGFLCRFCFPTVFMEAFSNDFYCICFWDVFFVFSPAGFLSLFFVFRLLFVLYFSCFTFFFFFIKFVNFSEIRELLSNIFFLLQLSLNFVLNK